jgi:hypothetical protein
VKHAGKVVFCIALAESATAAAVGMTQDTREGVIKLQALLGTREPPKWYSYY